MVIFCIVLILSSVGTSNRPEGNLIAETAARYPEAVAALKTRAEKALEEGPFRVTDGKTPPGGDAHDYFSLSPYHWPNPDTEDGLPWIFRDGKVNPEARSDAYDRERFGRMTLTVEDLALGWRYTRDRRFAERAAQLVRIWFLEPESRMNPNLQYAQYAPGVEKQPSWGIIRGNRLVRICEAMDWLDSSKAWTSDDEKALKAWIREYLSWLLESEAGKTEADAFNNHGSWYDVQVAALALYCGRSDLAEKILEEAGPKRIARQIRPDGRQFLECLRSKSWDYSIMNLEALFQLARLGENLKIDLWHYESTDGRSLKKALEYLIPFGLGEKPWPHRQITPFRKDRLYPLLRRAAAGFGDDRYREVMKRIPKTADIMVDDYLKYPAIGKAGS